MKELILVRHGEAEHLTKGIIGGWTDLPLTDRGKEQVSSTAKRLRHLFDSRIEVIYTSDLRRASESAGIINRQFDVPVIIDPLFREINRGVSQGKTIEEARKISNPISEPILDWKPYPEAESWRMLQNRVASVMTQIEQKLEEVVLIVAHANTNSAIVEWWLQLSEKGPIDFTLHPASITWLGISNFNHRELRKLNETAHLMNHGLDDCIP